MLILGLICFYFDAAVVFVKKTSLLFRLALAILCKMTVKSGLEINVFEIERVPSEIPSNLPGQFSLSGPIFLHFSAETLKKIVQFQNKKF